MIPDMYYTIADDCKISRMESVRQFAKDRDISVLDAELTLLSHDIIPYRYIGNTRFFGIDGQKKLLESKVCVIGCGGLGGSVCELLARLGIGNIVLADPDVFQESNLNRQLMCLEDDIGKAKAACTQKRINRINSALNVDMHRIKANSKNITMLLDGCSLCIDALDNIEGRLVLEKACMSKKIPLVHGAIGNAQFQLSVIKETSVLERIYPQKNIEAVLGSPVSTVALCAALQVGEAVKVLTGMEQELDSRLLVGNWLNHDYNVFDVSEKG